VIYSYYLCKRECKLSKVLICEPHEYANQLLFSELSALVRHLS